MSASATQGGHKKFRLKWSKRERERERDIEVKLTLRGEAGGVVYVPMPSWIGPWTDRGVVSLGSRTTIRVCVFKRVVHVCVACLLFYVRTLASIASS